MDRRKKPYLSAILAVIIMLSVSCFAFVIEKTEVAYGEEKCQLTGNIVEEGNKIKLTISLENGGDYLDSLQFDVGYDENAFNLEEVEDKKLIGSYSQFSATKEHSPYFCSWYVGEGGHPSEKEGDLVTLIFASKFCAEGKTHEFTVRNASGYRNVLKTVDGQPQIVEEKIRFSGINIACTVKERETVVAYTDGVSGGAVYFDTATGTIVGSDEGVTEVVLPKTIEGVTVTTIGEEAFAASNLEKITLPDTVTTIKDCAFWECTNLNTIVVPKSVTEISPGAFGDCTNLTEVTLPKGITKIGEQAFIGCRSLTEITLPNTVTEIEADAFRGCQSLQSVVIPKSVTTIGNDAFCACQNLIISGEAGSYAETYANQETIPFKTVKGVEVGGTVNSYGNDTEDVIIQLIELGYTEVSYDTSVHGNSTSYTITGVAPGTYTMKVMKKNHVSREYIVVVEAGDVELDVKIHLKGDVTGDGKINVADYMPVLAHAKGVSSLTGYAMQCSDITGDGKINVADYMPILAHAKGVSLLW